MIGHRLMGSSLLMTGDVPEGRMHLDQAIALYDSRPSSRPLAMRFGLDAGVVTLGYRSHALWSLGFPDAARADAERAVALARRETGHAAGLVHALSHMVIPQTLCGNAVAASAHAQEQVTLAEEKGSQFWKAFGMMNQGSVLALVGRPSDAVEILTASSIDWQATRSTLWLPFFLPRLARVHAELGQFEQAWRRIGEAMNLVEADQRKMGRGGDPPNRRRNRADVAPAGHGESADAFRARPRHCPRAEGKILGAAGNRRTWLGSGAITVSAIKPATFSPRFTVGSPKASKLGTCKRRSRCSKSYAPDKTASVPERTRAMAASQAHMSR